MAQANITFTDVQSVKILSQSDKIQFSIISNFNDDINKKNEIENFQQKCFHQFRIFMVCLLNLPVFQPFSGFSQIEEVGNVFEPSK